jgi:hypothetical protein
VSVQVNHSYSNVLSLLFSLSILARATAPSDPIPHTDRLAENDFVMMSPTQELISTAYLSDVTLLFPASALAREATSLALNGVEKNLQCKVGHTISQQQMMTLSL